jgi:16S rRNA (cytosine967-C5)-methyltransferase
VTTPVPGAAVRAQAARVLESVLDGRRSLKAVLAGALPGIADPRDRALLEAICFTALRHRSRYEYALGQWMQRPLPRKDGRVQHLLLAGLAQLDGLGLAAHAAVAATVEATRELGQAAHAALVNAILRRASRETLPASDDPVVATSHPEWLVAQLRADWPDAYDAILAANNEPAPLWLRANTRRASRTELVAAFRDARIACAAPSTPARAVRLDKPVALDDLPGWRGGRFSVQDGAAQLAVEALAPQPNERVLDACAAPGGKSAQIAEALIEGTLLALDVAATRLGPVEETLARLGLAGPNVRVQLGDASDPVGWWDGTPFDAVLLDAPCSATGIIRRQPDIKWHRREADIPELMAQQSRLLEAAWKTLRPGGRLLYSTCSVLKAENERQVDGFLARNLDAVARQLDARYGRPAGAGRQRLPGEDGMDGFFYALIEKRAA